VQGYGLIQSSSFNWHFFLSPNANDACMHRHESARQAVIVVTQTCTSYHHTTLHTRALCIGGGATAACSRSGHLEERACDRKPGCLLQHASMSSAALILKPDGNALCAGVIFGVEYEGSGISSQRYSGIGIVCPSSCIELFLRNGGSMRDLFVQTLQPELAVGIAAGCMRVAAGTMFAVNSTVGLCCLGIDRSSLQHFCTSTLDNTIFVSTTRGQTHTSTLSGGSGAAIAHDCYTCEGAWLWQRFGCFVDNVTMRVRCVRPLLLSGVPLTSRREVQALLLPAAVPTLLPDIGGWACGTALPICLAVAYMEHELAMAVDCIHASQREHVPGDFLEAMSPALAMKPDCVFLAATTEQSQQTGLKASNSSHSAALACAMRLSSIIQHAASSASEAPHTPPPPSSNTCQLLCSLMLRCCLRCRSGQRMWDTPDAASLNSAAHADLMNAACSWRLGCRAAAGAVISVLVRARSSSDAKFPPLQHTSQQCKWHQGDVCVISSYEAANPSPLSLGSADISAVVASLLQLCSQSIGEWQPQSEVEFNECLLLLQMMCGGCQPVLVTCAATLQQLLQLALMLLGSHADAMTLGGVSRRRRQQQQQQQHAAVDDEQLAERFQSEQHPALECGIGVCCNAIEVLHVRLGPLACRFNAPQHSQLLYLSLTSRLLQDLMSSPLKANAALVPFAQQLHSILERGRLEASIGPFIAACSHSFALLAASANASRGNFVRSCLVAAFCRVFSNAIEEAAPPLEGRACPCRVLSASRCNGCFYAEANSQPIFSQLSLALAGGLANIISSSLTRVLQCRLDADWEMRECLYKCVKHPLAHKVPKCSCFTLHDDCCARRE
jgi:hypothetical protein